MSLCQSAEACMRALLGDKVGFAQLTKHNPVTVHVCSDDVDSIS